MILIRVPKNICFNYDWPKDEIEFESLSENKIKNEIEQLFLKYKYENNIHEHGKEQNGWTA